MIKEKIWNYYKNVEDLDNILTLKDIVTYLTNDLNAVFFFIL